MTIKMLGSDGLRRYKLMACTVGVYAVCFAMVAAIATDEIRGAMFALPALGLASATIQLCAMWAVLGEGAYGVRAIASLIAGGMVAVSGLLVWILATDESRVREAWAAALMCGPLLWLLAQIPHAITRHYFGWKLVTEPQEVDRPIGIWDLLTVTSVVAGVLMLARVGSLQSFGLSTGGSVEEGWGVILVWMLVWCPLVYLGFCLPALLLTIRPRGKQAEKGCLTYTFITISAAVGLATLLLCFIPAPALFVIVGGYLCCHSFFFALPLRYLGEAGWELQSNAMISSSVSADPLQIRSEDSGLGS